MQNSQLHRYMQDQFMQNSLNSPTIYAQIKLQNTSGHGGNWFIKNLYNITDKQKNILH